MAAPRIDVDDLHEEIDRLPWHLPLEHWPQSLLLGLPRGISRHIVRFVRPAGVVLAVKETQEDAAVREHDMLQALRNLQAPAVPPLGHVTARRAADGSPLPGALITRHLRYSLPYRALFSQELSSALADRLVDALAVLLVRLHVAGFFWGDVSLSNTLFRRDADSFAAYLVDAETGELHDSLSDGQREQDLELARTNIAGEFLDLQAGGLVEASVDPLAVSTRLLDRYRALWEALTGVEQYSFEDRWRIDDRVRRLNALGFDLAEITVTTDLDGITTRIEPQVVEPGHHMRRLHRLTGIRAEENQARRLLNDLDAHRMSAEVSEDGEATAASAWLREAYLPVIRAVPERLRDRIEAPQLFHEFLEHRWFLSERAGQDVSTEDAIGVYIRDVLARYRSEASFLGGD